MKNNKYIHKRLWDLLGSRELSVFIFVMAMVYFLILLIFSMVVPPPWVQSISKLLPYKVLYILFFLNLLICEIKWIPVVIRRCRKPKPPEHKEDIERFRHRRRIGGSEVSVEDVATVVRRKGYKTDVRDYGPCDREQCNEELKDKRQFSKLLYASRGRFSPMGNLLFHLSFLFLLLGFGISALYRFDGTVILAEGQGTIGQSIGYVSIEKTNLLSVPEPFFEVSEIVPAFWMEKLLFTDLMAEVVFDGEKGITRLSQPLTIDNTKVSITGLGIAPEYLLRDRDGKEVDNGFVNLNIFMPGSEDWFVIPGTSYRVILSYYPDFEQSGNRITTRSMNPLNPVFRVKVFKGERRLYNGIVKPGEEVSFANVRLSFPSFKYSGIFRVLQDRGFIFIWIGLIMMIAGLIWRFLFYKKEIVVFDNHNGERYIAGTSDFYNRLFDVEVESMARASSFETS